MYQFSKIFAVKKVGGWGRGVAESEGMAAKIKNFRRFYFLIFSFCHNNDYVPEILET